MIDVVLPPLTQRELDLGRGLGMYWAFTHLAYYADHAIPARTTLSFQRSYAPDSITRFPRAVNGTPAFIVAQWVEPKEPRVVIAVEGTREWAQILVWSASVANVTEPTVGEYVLQTFRDYANNIQSSLIAANVWTNAFLRSAAPVDFAGHSLGAAIVEILADRVARAAPGKPVNLVKFGSPRIGTNGWTLNRAPLASRRSVYAHIDPIDFLPRYAMARGVGGISPVVLDSGFLVRDRSFQQIGLNGRQEYTRHIDSLENAMRFMLRLQQSVTPLNEWYWHHRNAYRLIIGERTAGDHFYNSLRFQHIELPDENSWGVNFQPGRGIQDDMLVITDPNPADVATGFTPPATPPGPTLVQVPLPQPITGMGLDNVQRGQFSPPPRLHRGHAVP